MAVTPIDALFFAAAAYLGKRGLDESKPRDPSDVLPPGLDPPPVTPDVRDGDPIPDLCVGSSIVMPRDRQLMALTEPAGPDYADEPRADDPLRDRRIRPGAAMLGHDTAPR